MSPYIQVLHQQTRGGGGLEKTKEHQTLFFFALECLDQLDEIW